jgi:pimeloyl-ACP methyl ester carboxylesterase
MKNFRIYGRKPYNLVVLHGGPGLPGEMEPVAKQLSSRFGILEPLLTSLTINEQVEEIRSIILKKRSKSVIIIGHSWGAWLGLIFAHYNPESVRKLILVGTPPFEEKYVTLIFKTRMSRLSAAESDDFISSMNLIEELSDKNKAVPSSLLHHISKTDNYDIITEDKEYIFYPAVYNKIWNEASELRKNGKIVEFIRQITASVVAIHGDYDPHPAEAVKGILESMVKNFRFILLNRCGHYPWKEYYCRKHFFNILRSEAGIE